MRFDVLSRREVQEYGTTEKHIVISIASLGQPNAELPVLESRVDTLYLQFADIDRIRTNMPKKLRESIFNKNLAKAIWGFVDKYENEVDLIIVNCEAGISRSSAVAASISKILNEDDIMFFKYFIPNMLVYRKMLEVKLQ